LKVYLSGGMEHSKDGGLRWRWKIENWLRENLKHDVFNPVIETEKFLSEHHPNINLRGAKKDFLEIFKGIIKNIVERDLKAIAECDYVICYWDESAREGAGTQGEITIAKFLNKPIYLVSNFDFEEIPSWIIGCVDEIFYNFDDLKIFLTRKFKSSDETHCCTD
jgi:hypothetical protein